MHSITLTGGLADELGSKAMVELVKDLAAAVHADVELHVAGGRIHDGYRIVGNPPPAQPVRLVKLGADSWMIQARYGKNHDGEPYNAAGSSRTFPTQDAAKEWLMAEPAGRWYVVL